MTKKTTITQAEYLQLRGLEAMAKQYYARLEGVRDSIYELLGVKHNDDYSGHVWEVIFGSLDADSMLDAMNITVEEKASGDEPRKEN